MPRGHGRAASYTERVLYGGSCTLSRGSIIQNKHLCCSKEHQPSALVFRNSEQRSCIILTLVKLQLDASWKLLGPFLLPVQGSDHENHLTSGAHSDGVEAPSPAPFYFFLVELQNEQTCPTEHSDSAKPFNHSRASAVDVLGECGDKARRTKAVKNTFSSSLSSSSLSDNSSASVGDGLDPQLDFSTSNVSAVEKPGKKSSKKKGKKGGKKYKKSKPRKTSADLETRYDQSTRCKSLHNTDPVHSVEHVTTDSWSQSLTSNVLLAEDIAWDKRNLSAGGSGDTNSSATSMTVTSFSDALDESESTASSQIFSYDVKDSQFDIDEATTESSGSSSPTQTLDRMSRFDEHVTTSGMSENGTCSSISSVISFDQANDSILEFVPSSPKKDGKNYMYEMPSSCKDDTELCQSKSGITHGARNNFTSFDMINTNSQHKNSESSSDSYESSPHSSTDAISSDNNTERAQCSIQACSSDDDFQPVIYRKKARSNRKMTGSLNGRQTYSSADVHGQTDVSRFGVWQNVIRNSAGKCIRKSEGAKVTYPRAETSLESPNNKMTHKTLKGLRESRREEYDWYVVSDTVQTAHKDMLRLPSTSANSSEVLPEALDGKLTQSVVEKLEKKATSQVILHQVTQQQNIGELGNSEFQENVVVPNDVAHCSPPDPQTTPQENFHNSICSTPLEAEEDQHETLIMHLDPLDRINNEVNSHESGNLIYEKIDPTNVLSEADDNRHNNSYVSKLQKQNFARSNDLVLNTSNTEDGRVASSGLDLCYSPSTAGSASCTSGLQDTDPPLGADEQNDNLRCNSDVLIEFGTVSRVSNDLFSKNITESCFSGSETSLDRILHSVHDSCKLQTASESIQRALGSPLAEFEKLVYSASPIVGRICNRTCKICSPCQLVGSSLCKHLIPDISLGSLWQWYEKPGNYGLEIKAEDYHNLRRSHNGRSGFHAYFVPYLSAIQIFGASRSSLFPINYDSSKEAIETCKKNITSVNSSGIGTHSVFSFLPHPSKEVEPCMLQPSSSAKVGVCNQSVSSTSLGCEELLFEYFESDQPHLRKPFFEKIKELVGGDKSSNSLIFGDPSQLENLHLLDIHPASWYSVAWYPIYRIPDGDFRAAFLTYHSLGHFVQRTVPSNRSDICAHIVSPVVGLQSYNAKVECWFRMRDLKSNAARIGKEPSPNFSEIFGERLKTLELTASAMARASVHKGNVTSVNRQPDYEFFSTRSL